MCFTTLTLLPVTIATQSLAGAANHDIHRAVDGKAEHEFRPVRMNWVVVTDPNGHRQLQMRWRAN
jgi:hypothetical protein